MTLTLQIPADLEGRLSNEASQLGLPLSQYILHILSQSGRRESSPMSGAQLVAYWENEGVIGARGDIADSAQHARDVRRRAEERERP